MSEKIPSHYEEPGAHIVTFIVTYFFKMSEVHVLRTVSMATWWCHHQPDRSRGNRRYCKVNLPSMRPQLSLVHPCCLVVTGWQLAELPRI